MKTDMNDLYCRRQRAKARHFSAKMAVEHRAKDLSKVGFGNDTAFWELHTCLIRAIEDLATEYEEHQNCSELILMLKEEEVA